LVAGIVTAHEDHNRAMELIKQAIKKRGLDTTWRHRIGDLEPDDFDLVITVGGDGTVLHASHSISDTPVLAVNSSPYTSVGFFTCADAAHFPVMLDKVLSGEVKPSTLSRMEIKVNGEVVTDCALNDALFCHDCPASTTRYTISFKNGSEHQLSSGVWVATAAGSTAAIRSAGGHPMPPRSKRLQFAVREPFPSGGKEKQSQPTMTRGFVKDGKTLTLRSKTEAARLYVDGPHVVFPVAFGDEVTFSRSNNSLRLYKALKPTV
jgi:NAD+ kinase